ncbi:jmjC domain-containing histone demethylation protein 1 [Copidosoma floridanum]|uniref:jmjC domain-containing histone demethylation protein 1 n=1 Tax=Copidosoma floridanum TaxID=29053 RepID=UPI0006C97E61|nr:jmjC domain-containing histone demethylation protein 1 [Copidosoma floridanum]
MADSERYQQAPAEYQQQKQPQPPGGRGKVQLPPPPRRQLRERTKKLYTDDWAFGDDEIEGRRGFQVEEKIESTKYSLENFHGFYCEMTGPELTVAHLQKNGLQIPILVKEKTGLGLRVPSTNFTVNDVRTCVGSRRLVDVMDVNTQKNEEMTMKEWQKYYEDPNKTRLLNVISLEFSRTKLEHYVQQPKIVRQIDWVDVVWPKHLKDAQTEATNLLEDMMYPKVQKYCLMSVKGCYTDFHVDFGGTSVWYHILKGGKIFWLIPPTEKNIALYEKWVLSGKQSDTFFGDMVDKCGRITLSAGNTMFIPTGWIHAVFTPDDSLVFGGNFLHSFGIDKQLRVAQVEETTKVPHKFRYPYFTEMLWYVLERYVHILLDRSHIEAPEVRNQNQSTRQDSKHIHLTPLELHGLKSIVMYLHSLPSTKKNVPELIRDPVALIHDVRCLVEQHRHDSHELAITGTPVLPAPPLMTIGDNEKMNGRKKTYRQPSGRCELKSNGPKHRRTRCKKCEACTRSDCGECVYCLDMIKFGGTGRAKQTCLQRKCMRPMLAMKAACKVCGLDGWNQKPAPLMGKQAPVALSNLMECSICSEIVHPTCLNRGNLEGSAVISDDMPNSWECPDCCEAGRNQKLRRPSGRPRKMSVSGSNDVDSEKINTPVKKMRVEDEDFKNEISQEQEVTPVSISSAETSSEQQTITENHQSTTQVVSSYNTHNVTKKPYAAVRSVLPVLKHQSIEYFQQPYIYNKIALLSIFKYLSPSELVNTACVCRTWARYSFDSSLWRTIDLAHDSLTAAHLSGIMKRQPETLILDWTNIAKKQLVWLLCRLPQLRNLSLKGCHWYGVCALNTSSCPPLTKLDLSFVGGLNDLSVRDLLNPPSDAMSGLIDKTSRLKYLRSLSLCNTDITDVTLRYIAQHLPHIESLDLASCTRLTDAGVAQLTTPPAKTITSLVSLNMSGCRLLTEVTLDYLQRCQALKHLDLRDTMQVFKARAESFAAIRNLSSFYVNMIMTMPTASFQNVNYRQPTQEIARNNIECREAERIFVDQQQQATLCKYI